MPGCNATVNNEPCPNDPTLAWERWATLSEIAMYIGTGDLPQGSTEAKLMVFACDDHHLATPELMALTHESDCSAPPVCNCVFS